MDLVTAIITTCKREPAIVERAIKSIINQTYSNMQYVLVDDSPEDYEFRDDVKKIAQKYQYTGLEYIQHERCMGACAARNTGLKAAKGKYIAFLDDDDEWRPNKIDVQIKAFTNDSIALVYCGSITHNDDDGHEHERPLVYKYGMVYDELILGNFVGSTSFPLLRTDYLREIGGFDILMQSAQDYDVWLRLAKQYEFNYVKETLVVYHIHSSDQISKSSLRRINGLERILEKNMEYLNTHPRARWKRFMLMVPEYSGNNDKKKAICVWFKAMIICPSNLKENLMYLYSILRMEKK